MDLATTFQPLFNLRSSQPTTLSSSWFSGLFGATSKNGIPINTNSALTLSAFYNGIEIITNDFAKLPKAVFQKQDKNRIKKTDHPVQYLIGTKPNQYMTAIMFHKTILQHALLKGNGYAEIIRNNYTSQPSAIQLIDQDKTPVEVVKFNDKLFYKFNNKVVPADNMLHLPGFSFNGITGISVITHAAQSLGIALSSQEFGTEYYVNKGIGMGVVTAAQPMDPDAKIRYGKAMGEALSSNGSSFKVAVADEAKGFTHLRISPQEAEFLATNKFGIEDVARWLNVPLHKLKSTENINNSITEQLEIAHVADSIVPWALKMEAEYKAKLFTSLELKNGYYVKFNEAALLRADKKTQSEFWSKLIYAGVYTRNEVRGLLEMNQLDGLDEPLTPVNTQLMEQIELQLKLLKNTSNE
ncbi:phage portal protein [Lutibacter aestuarii]|uniref:Phage portal protein n=1 Tax=Lutibacter aestuarii TaxID=861111 RepID=A0ABW2Z937_9FLAO